MLAKSRSCHAVIELLGNEMHLAAWLFLIWKAIRKICLALANDRFRFKSDDFAKTSFGSAAMKSNNNFSSGSHHSVSLK